MKLLVTGGAGYVGSVVVAKLAAAGHDVTVIDNLSHGHRDAVPRGVRFVQANVAELDTAISASDGIEAVLHFAAFIAAGESMQQPGVYRQNNTVASLLMLEAMRRLNIKQLIFSSTAAVYGNQGNGIVSETTPTIPTSTYGMTKLAVDMAIGSYCSAHGFAAVSLRYFNVAGAYGSYGERHPVETHIIPIVLGVAADSHAVFSMFGTDYPTPDGTCVRDYIHVSDLADAHLLALGKLQAGQHVIYNLGNGNGFSNQEIVEAVERVTGRPVSTKVTARRDGDLAKLVADSSKAKGELGWTPQKPSLDEIIRDAWDFYQLHSSVPS